MTCESQILSNFLNDTLNITLTRSSCFMVRCQQALRLFLLDSSCRHGFRHHIYTCIIFKIICYDQIQELKDFLEKPGANPNIRNEAGDTPLIHYVKHQVKSRLGRMYMYIVLYYGRGVDIDARDAAGNTALHIAAQVYVMNNDLKSTALGSAMLISCL